MEILIAIGGPVRVKLQRQLKNRAYTQKILATLQIGCDERAILTEDLSLQEREVRIEGLWRGVEIWKSIEPERGSVMSQTVCGGQKQEEYKYQAIEVGASSVYH